VDDVDDTKNSRESVPAGTTILKFVIQQPDTTSRRSNAVKFLRYYFRFQYSYRFLGMPIFDNMQWQPHVSDPQFQKNKRSTD